jgi:exodeoxyribonuclease-1
VIYSDEMTGRNYFFYDLETSGLSSAHQRIIQFAGQRTDEQLVEIGEPINLRIELPLDVIPEPTSLPITGKGITEMRSGACEAQIAGQIHEVVFTPGTQAIGFNNLRFDDQFIRTLFWRNFWDPYSWSYRDGRGRLDILPIVWMFRALSPGKLDWPMYEDDPTRPDNRLVSLVKAYGITDHHAHDALGDVVATIALARLLRASNPGLFAYAERLQNKHFILDLLSRGKPLLWSGSPSMLGPTATTLIAALGQLERGKVAVYDLRYSPAPWLGLSDEQLDDKLSQADQANAGPLHRLATNTNPCLVSYQLLERHPEISDRLGFDLATIETNFHLLTSHPDFFNQLKRVWQEVEYAGDPDVDGQLYDGFSPPEDARWSTAIHQASTGDLAHLQPVFQDQRLQQLWFRYRARNYPALLSATERLDWQQHLDLVRQPESLYLVDFDRQWAAVHAEAQARHDQQGRHTLFNLDELRTWASDPSLWLSTNDKADH